MKITEYFKTLIERPEQPPFDPNIIENNNYYSIVSGGAIFWLVVGMVIIFGSDNAVDNLVRFFSIFK